jgi:hypothetical protein
MTDATVWRHPGSQAMRITRTFASLDSTLELSHRHSSGCGPMVVAEHSVEALAALNRMMG